MVGWPILRTAPLAMSSSATCPVACHSSSSFSNGVDIRLGNVRSRFRSESAILTVGLVGAAGAAGIGARPPGTWTKTMVLHEPFLVGAEVRERDVQVPRRQHRIRQLLRGAT